jgi:hypothetical protein
MEKYIYIAIVFLQFFFFNKIQAQEKTIDTIYIRVYREDLDTRFFNNQNNQLSIDFHFKIDWELHNLKKEKIFFSYQSPKKEGINGWSIFIKDVRDYLLYKNFFTLQQFTKALKSNDFSIPIQNGKVQIMMLYGEKCSTKFEVYPVKVGTNLSRDDYVGPLVPKN